MSRASLCGVLNIELHKEMETEMTTADFTLPAAGREAGVLGTTAMWVAVLILALTVGYNASITALAPAQALSVESTGTTTAPQIEDWHGNVRRSGPDYRY